MEKFKNPMTAKPETNNVESDEKNYSLNTNNWEGSKNMTKDFFDDGTISFFWLMTQFHHYFTPYLLY